MIYPLYTLFSLTAFFLLVTSIWKMRKSTVVIPLGYFLTGTVLLAVIGLFFALVDGHILQLDEMTVMICWHLLFYLATGSLLFGSHGLSAMADIRHSKQSPKIFMVWSVFSVLAAVGVIIQGLVWNELIMTYFTGSWLERAGIMHLVALLFAAAVAYSLILVRRRFLTSLGRVSIPFIVALATMAVIHLWELVWETWHLLSVSVAVGEGVERVLWVLVYGANAYAFWRLRKSLEN